MEIIINHNPKVFEETKISISSLLSLESIHQIKGIAVARNNQVVPQRDWDRTFIEDHDQILIITATQGG